LHLCSRYANFRESRFAYDAMNLDSYLKTQANTSAFVFASRIGVPAPLLSQWRTGARQVPIERCLAIERATGGLVTRGELRPHDAHQIWPDLSDKSTPPSPRPEENPHQKEAAHV